MLGGKFVVTFHNNTLFILDSINGMVVGVVVFKDGIKSVSTSGGFLFILTNGVSKGTVIVRVAVHYSYVTAKSEVLKLPRSATSSVSNSPMGSCESLIRDELPGVVDEGLCDSTKQHESLDQIVDSSDDQHHEATPLSDVVTEMPVNVFAALPTVLISDVAQDTVTEPVVHIDVIGSTHVTSESCVEELSETVNFDARIEAGSKNLRQATLVPQEGSSNEVLDKSGIAKSDDKSRRVRMTQAAGDDIVAGNKTHRKRRKKTKGKKLSSVASECNVLR
jgi:hypothetical protein